MAYLYPIALKLAGRLVVVVGGGAVACRKIRGLGDSDARIKVICPDVSPEWKKNDTIDHVARRYQRGDLAGAVLAFACTDDRGVNRQVADDARQAGIWCNVADDPRVGDFHLPAVMRDGLLTLSVATEGADPMLAGRLRDALQEEMGVAWGSLLEQLAELRRELNERFRDPRRRQAIHALLCGRESRELLRIKGKKAWHQWARQQIEQET